MATNIYQVIIKDPVSGEEWELLPKSYNFTDTLNKETTATFYFSFRELEKMAARNQTSVLNIFTTALREIYINRNGTKIFYGVVTSMDVEPVDGGDMTATIKAFSWFGLFKKRLVGKGTETIYSAVDAGDIAWDLIDDSQNSDGAYSTWGITQGATPATKVRDRSYLFDIIYDAIIALSNDNLADGFDFDIDNTKAFNIYYPTKGTTRANVVFDERTAKKWRYSKRILPDITNVAYVVGAGFNDVITNAVRTASTTYRSPFGNLEEKLDARNVSEAATLNDKGDQRLAEAREAIVELSGLEHYDNIIGFSDYEVGDIITANYPELGITNLAKRVRSKTFTMQTPESIGAISIKVE